ncbi:MAG TPA: hypothetical protein V6C89_08960 [Drouetiella sp.]
MEASIIWALIACVVTEVLSFFTSLTKANLAIAWSLALSVCIATAVRGKISVKFPSLHFTPALCAMMAIVAALAVLSVYCPPNNYDSLTYHLSRIEHWINNQSVAHFPIHVLRQLTMNPGAEYLIMQLRLLSGADYLSNAVQWFSMVGCLIGTSLLAKQLGAHDRGQILASALCLTIPIGILESTSTQTDYVAAFWFVCFLLNLKPFSKRAVWSGLSLGLFALTKQTAYFYALPFLLIGAISDFKQSGFKALKPLSIVAALTILLCAPFFTRNFVSFGTPFVNKCVYEDGYRANNDACEPKYFFSNVMRNFAAEMFTPVPFCNNLLVHSIEKIHELFHWDASDPKSTFDGITFTAMHPGFQLQEDIAGNPLHTVLFAVAIGILILNKQIDQRRTLLLYTAALAVGFLLFSAVLKWQPWHSRLLLPLYVVESALAACALSRIPERLSSVLIAILLIYSAPYVLLNPNKFVLGDENIFVTSRDENYFRGVPNFYNSYRTAVDFLRQQHAALIGVVANDTSWCEYPLWVLLTRNFTQPGSIEGLSAPEWQAYNRKTPDALISYDRKPPETISLPAKTFRKCLSCDSPGDRVYYHFFGHSVGHSYGHLTMAIYLPEPSAGLSQALGSR